MKKLAFVIATGIIFWHSASFSQSEVKLERIESTSEYLEELFSSGKTFEEITSAADSYFENKYPELTPYELTTGEYRDGDFVKYQRWKAFWKLHLNDDGTLGDFTKAARNTNRSGLKTPECSGDEFMVDWTNSNYAANMGWQIDQGRTSSMAFHPIDPNTYWVGAAFGGLWKTTDGGSTYSLLNDDLPLAAISGIAIDPTDPDKIAIALSDIVWYGPPGIERQHSNLLHGSGSE